MDHPQALLNVFGPPYGVFIMVLILLLFYSLLSDTLSPSPLSFLSSTSFSSFLYSNLPFNRDLVRVSLYYFDPFYSKVQLLHFVHFHIFIGVPLMRCHLPYQANYQSTVTVLYTPQLSTIPIHPIPVLPKRST